MKTKTLNKVSTWVPGFSGFYGSIWDEGIEDLEIENINEVRKEKGLSSITWDDCEWDYESHYKVLSKEITGIIGKYLAQNGFISDFIYEKLSSPKEYNFSNGVIYVTFLLNSTNKKIIQKYLENNREQFSSYLKDKYTSGSGFCSSYSYDIDVWLKDDYLTHEHKLGAVLDFILEHHLKTTENEESIDNWLDDKIENKYIEASNYLELTESK